MTPEQGILLRSYVSDSRTFQICWRAAKWRVFRMFGEMMPQINKLEAIEILDSRGYPTLAVTVTLSSGAKGVAKVPSGASTGTREAVELRDGDKLRYSGKGVLRAVEHVCGAIQQAVSGMDGYDQRALDDRLCVLDGTTNKSKLGANAILGVSLAAAHAAAVDKELPLYAYLSDGSEFLLPTPMLNVLNGGRHADNSLDFQEFMAVGDEGGFAPELKTNEQAVELILEAINKAGYVPGRDIAIMLDPAASEFFEEGDYVFRKSDRSRLKPSELIALYQEWLRKYPEIWSIEDGLAEGDPLRMAAAYRLTWRRDSAAA